MSDFKVFYSWQSDLPNPTNRTFIGDALKKACEEVSKNPDVLFSPRVDQDTQGVTGSPPIPATIMQKIDECQAFVADVSLCFNGPKGKLAPNPNVAYELGYAVAKLGWERIILVMNIEHGGIDSLPFDLEKRRVTGPYRASTGEQNRSDERKSLIGKLAGSIEAITHLEPVTLSQTPAAEAIQAIENETPVRKKRIREYGAWLVKSLRNLDPGPGIAVDSWVAALSSTSQLMLEFTSVIEAAAIAEDESNLFEFWRLISIVVQEYDVPPGFSGQFYPLQFDWWKFHGRELVVLIAISLLREGKLDLLSRILDEQSIQNNWASVRGSGVVNFIDMNAHVKFAEEWNIAEKARGKNGYISPYGRLLQLRYADIEAYPNLWTDYLEADLLLALLAQTERYRSDYKHWSNWTHPYLQQAPAFLLKAAAPTYARSMAKLFGFETAAQFRGTLETNWRRIDSSWEKHGFYMGVTLRLNEIRAIAEF